MKKIISMSVYGNNHRYTKGAIENAKLRPVIYPNWVLRIYAGPEVNKNTIETLKNYNCEVVIMDKFIKDGTPNTNSVLEGMFWRFLPISEPETECMISRDSDSRLNVREKAAVDEWLLSGKKAHVMRDHWIHNLASVQNKCFMMGGMWGIRGSVVKDITGVLKTWAFNGQYSDDQSFINKYIWPFIENDVLIHGDTGKPFPSHPPFNGYVGEAILEP